MDSRDTTTIRFRIFGAASDITESKVGEPLRRAMEARNIGPWMMTVQRDLHNFEVAVEVRTSEAIITLSALSRWINPGS